MSRLCDNIKVQSVAFKGGGQTVERIYSFIYTFIKKYRISASIYVVPIDGEEYEIKLKTLHVK